MPAPELERDLALTPGAIPIASAFQMAAIWALSASRAGRITTSPAAAEAMKKFVEAGLGLSVTSEFFVKADVAARRLVAMRLVPSLDRQIGLVRRRDKPVAPPLAAFLGALANLRTSLTRRR